MTFIATRAVRVLVNGQQLTSGIRYLDEQLYGEAYLRHSIENECGWHCRQISFPTIIELLPQI